MLNKTMRHSVLPLFLLIVIDGMGFGMTIPVLAPLLTKSSASILGTHTTLSTRHLLYGIIMFMPPAAYFFGAPLIGYFSDRFGRKPILAWCLAGTFLSYLLYIVSFRYASLWILIVARLIGGFTTGSQAVAQAAMADISEGKTKVLNIGIIALAMTIGLIAGPLMGGILANTQYVTWFSAATPFYAAAILSLVNFILLVGYLHETQKTPTHSDNKRFAQQLKNFMGRPANLHILLIFFCFELGWSLYYQGIAVTAVDLFHLSGVNVGYFSTYIGLSLSFGLIFILRLVATRCSLLHIVRRSLWIGVISLFVAFWVRHLWGQILLALPITFMVATTYSSLITLLSDHNENSQQGLVMGTSDATLSLAFAITGFLSGWLTIYSATIPLLIASLFMLCAVLLARQIATRRA